MSASNLIFPQSALKERGIDKMLEEARDDHKESDAIHMRRKCQCRAKYGWRVTNSYTGDMRSRTICKNLYWYSGIETALGT